MRYTNSGMVGEAPGEANSLSVPKFQETGPWSPELISYFTSDCWPAIILSASVNIRNYLITSNNYQFTMDEIMTIKFQNSPANLGN